MRRMIYEYRTINNPNETRSEEVIENLNTSHVVELTPEKRKPIETTLIISKL